MKIFTKLLIPLIAVVVIFVSSNINWYNNDWKNLMGADAKGYYSYLPAVFIYHDLSLSFHDSIEQKYYTEHTRGEYRSRINDHYFSKFPAGVAVCLSPFFLAGHMATKITGGLADGYSRLYIIFVTLGSVFYLCIGLFYLRKTLTDLKFNATTIGFVILGLTFATNLFYYTVREPGASHIYSFAFINLFAFYFIRYTHSKASKHLIICTLAFATTILIRNLNAFAVLLLPLLCDFETFQHTLNQVLKNKKHLAFAVSIPIVFYTAQLMFYKIQTGLWLFDPYLGEHFYFSKPHFFDILFSYKKGLFVYTPLLLLSLTGLIFIHKTNKKKAILWVGFFILLTYLLSSWWCWYYGGSFGLRAYIDYYIYFGVLLAYAFESSSKYMKYVLATASLACLLLCQIQTYQYRYTIIHWSEMTKEKYWDVFLKLKK